MWTESRDSWTAGWRYVRNDGAVVKYQMGPGKMEWIAFEPNPSEEYLARTNRRGLTWPRRWKSAEAAMRAVDREYPLQQSWYCEPCAVEVYDRTCPHCGKTRRQRS